MDYTLVLGIEYQKHKRPATVDLFIGGQLIDSFEMDQDQSVAKDPLGNVDRTWYEQNGKANWLDINRGNDGLWSTIPNYYRIYKLSEETVNGCLEIQVKNDSNNYTNGFMTKSSLIRFTVVALLPSKLLNSKQHTLMGLIHWAHSQRGDKPFPTRQRWPIAMTMDIKTDKKNYKCDDVQRSWIGGNFTAVMDIKVKHKVKYLHSPGRIHTGFGAIDTSELSQLLSTLKPLINIYNED